MLVTFVANVAARLSASGTTGHMHAVVIGISEYADAPELTTAGPAMSAARFAGWLRNEYRHPKLELGSLRVLLSPTEAEREAAQEAAGQMTAPRIARRSNESCPTGLTVAT